MELRDMMIPGAETAAKIVQAIPSDRLAAPTPNPEWDVRATVNHLHFWVRCAEYAARKQAPDGPAEGHDFVAEPGWADHFAEQARRTATAWSDPAAWEGDTSLTGNPSGFPATMIGGMIFSEFVLHGWDLAVATGQPAALPEDLVAAAHAHTSATAEMARQYGAFGPEVPVPADAPVLDRLLGLSGRDPHWTP